MNKQMLSTLFVGVDVSLHSQHAVFLDFFGEQLASFPFPNNASGASLLISNIISHAASMSVIQDLSPEYVAYASLDELIDFIMEKGKKRFSSLEANVKLLQRAARDSYRLDKALYEPLNASIAASFNCIKALEREVKTIDDAISKAINSLAGSEYKSLLSVKGFGPVISAGIIAEIGFISRFSSEEKLAKYAGLTWRKKQSGAFTSDITYMTKTGSQYLRYYLGEAVVSLIKHGNPEYTAFYRKKYNEAIRFKHKRALALTSRKLVRLIFALLRDNQLYTNTKETSEAF